MKQYFQKLLDPRWQKKRLQIMERDGFCCVICGDAEMTLHVHHLYYCKGREPWEYPDFALSTQCKSCHANAEQDCRDDDGIYVPAEWEKTINTLLNGVGAQFAVSEKGLWDIANQLHLARNLGATHDQAIGVILHAITDYKQSLEPPE